MTLIVGRPQGRGASDSDAGWSCLETGDGVEVIGNSVYRRAHVARCALQTDLPLMRRPVIDDLLMQVCSADRL
jgi:hypothetical protein